MLGDQLFLAHLEHQGVELRDVETLEESAEDRRLGAMNPRRDVLGRRQRPGRGGGFLRSLAALAAAALAAISALSGLTASAGKDGASGLRVASVGSLMGSSGLASITDPEARGVNLASHCEPAVPWVPAPPRTGPARPGSRSGSLPRRSQCDGRRCPPPPCSGWMKPYPLALLNHFTVPCWDMSYHSFPKSHELRHFEARNRSSGRCRRFRLRCHTARSTAPGT